MWEETRGNSTNTSEDGWELLVNWVLRQNYQTAFTINNSGRRIQDKEGSTHNDPEIIERPRGEKNWSLYTQSVHNGEQIM